VQQREYRRHNRHQQRPDERNELKRTRNDAHHETTRQSQQRETDRTNHADEQTRGQLCADVSRERAVDVLKKLVAAPTPTAARQHQQRRPAKALSVFE